MLFKAPRLPARLWRPRARGALAVSCMWLIGGMTTAATAQNIGHWYPPNTIVDAEFFAPTTVYKHGVLGDEIEWSSLLIKFPGPKASTMTVEIPLPKDHVFEDIHPRLVDLNLDGQFDAALVVETDLELGAALALYGTGGKIAETPHIGTSFRWLAPIGTADLDGDGFIEIAYIDRPHLAKVLRIWRFKDDDLTEITALPGLTNHRIGEDFITGGVRDCGTGPELVVVSGNWKQIVSVSYDQDWTTETLSPFTRTAMKQALNCSG